MRGNENKSYWLTPGTVLQERYRIDKVLEEGGFGVVYLGYDTMLELLVSIKEYFPREMADRPRGTQQVIPYKGEGEQLFAAGLKKFLSEAQSLARCNHISNVVVARDFFYENNTAYLIMEYIQGENIGKYVREQGALDPGRVLESMKPVLKSLEKIHKTGIVHRDISPDNIIIDREGQIYLIDFGSTRPYTAGDYKTMTVFFKRGYAAEEQYREYGEQGPWTDVYSLCATMYFMITGEVPLEAAQRNIRDTLKPLTDYRDISMPLHQKRAIMKGMAVKRGKRYPSVAELYRHLYEQEKEIPWVSFPWGAVGVGMILILLGGTAGAVSLRLHHQPVQGEQRISPSPTTITPTRSPFCEIADVTGKTINNAKALLKKQGGDSLTIRVHRRYSKSVPKGRVIHQSLEGGTLYPEGEKQEIVLTVSRGQKPERDTVTPKGKPGTLSGHSPTPAFTEAAGTPQATSSPETPIPKSNTSKPDSTGEIGEDGEDYEEDYAGDLPF